MDQDSQTRRCGADVRAEPSAVLGAFLYQNEECPSYLAHCEDRTVGLQVGSINPCDPVRLPVLIPTCFLGIS